MVGCCVFYFKFWPLKAKAPFPLYFLTCVVLRPPNKSTSRGPTKPEHGRLAWDHGMPWHHVLWAPLAYPWSERTKPLKGRAAAAHLVVVHFVFCVVVTGGLLAKVLYQRYLLCRKLNIKSAKMANLCTLIDNDVPNKIQNSKSASKLQSFLDFEAVLTSWD